MSPEEIQEVLQTYPAIQEMINDRDAKIKALTADLDAASEALDALQNSATTGTAGSPLPSVKVGDKDYTFTAARFSYKATDYTAQEAAKLPDLCAELVKIGAGILSEVTSA